jgi:uncharacterized protein
MLVEHNADVHIRNDLGMTPLHVAARPREYCDHIDIMQVLLDHGANPNARDNHGSTPLHHLSWSFKPGYSVVGEGTVEGTRLLLKHGAIVDAEDNKGRTTLQLALDHRRRDIAICLKENGATPPAWRLGGDVQHGGIFIAFYHRLRSVSTSSTPFVTSEWIS